MLRAAIREMGNYLIALSNPKEVPLPKPPAKPRAESRSDDFERRMRRQAIARKAAAKGGTPAPLVAGSVQFLGMDEFKRSFGSSWQSIAKIAYVIAADSIRKHLSDEDVFRRNGDDTFILSFATANKAEAEAKTRAITQEIRKLLAEQAPESGLGVDHTVGEIEWLDEEAETGSVADRIALALSKVREDAERAAASWRQHLVQNAAIRYSPIWIPAKRAVTGFRVMLDSETGKRTLDRLSTVSSPEDMKLTLFELDCLLIGRGIEALHKLFDRGGKAQFLIPINFSTLDDRPYREQYLKLCQNVPEAYKKFMLFHLHGIPSATLPARLVDIGRALKPHAQGVFVDIPALQSPAFDFTATSFHGIAIASKAFPTLVSEASQRLTKLVSAAKASGLVVFVHGADTVGSVETALNALVDFVEGRGVALPAGEPKAAYRWNLRRAG